MLHPCSRGERRLIGNKRAADAAGEAAVRSRDLFRLNSVDLCVDMLREDLEWDVEPNLLAAYHAFAEAQVLMDDTFARLEGVSLPARAGEALSLLDKAAAYVSATLSVAGGAEGAGRVAELQPAAALAAVVADATRARRSWAGSVWRESFYGSELSFVSFAPAEGAEGAEGQRWRQRGRQRWQRGRQRCWASTVRRSTASATLEGFEP